MPKSKGKADKKDPKKGKDVKKKKEDKKKVKKKKTLESIIDVLPLTPEAEEEVEEVEEEVEVREPCIQDAAIHLWYQNRVKTKTDSELELEKELAKQQQNVTDDSRVERSRYLKNIHRVVMSTVAYMLQTTLMAVEDGVLDADKHVHLLCGLFEDGGRYAVVFTYNTNEYHDVDPVTDEVTTFTKKTIVVSDGSDRFEDYVVIVARNRNNFTADIKLITDEYLYSGFPLGTQSSTVLTGLSFMFSNIVRESINALTNWQQLTSTREGQKITRYFKEDIKDFSSYLTGTKKALDCLVKFTYPDDLMPMYVGTPESVAETVNDNDRIAYVENAAEAWFDIIEGTLTDCDKLIGEKGEPLPDTALDSCRTYVAKYCSILDFMKTTVCNKTIGLLKNVKSHLLHRWQDLESRVIVNRITVIDQLKYLNAVRKYWAPLSRCSPSTVGNHLNSLLYSFRQVYASSKIMSSPQRMTVILLKVTNSLLSNCICYLTNDNRRTIWQQGSQRLLKKFEICLRLHREWHIAYEKMMEDIDSCPDEKQFGCSTVQIFGKLDSFKIRLLKLKDFILKRTRYGVLALSPLEGLEEHTLRFNKIFSIIPGRLYDPLEHRDHHFNDDYDIFLSSIADAEEKLNAFMFSKLADLPNSETLLYMLQRFEKLHIDALNYNEAYANILQLYMYELEELRDNYNFERSKIIPSMFAPPMSARIIWIRGLSELIRRPMKFFESKECLETSPISQKVIKHYNALLTTFIHFEHVFHHEWLNQFGYIEELLAQPVLFHVEGSKEKMVINFDNRILLTFIEVDCFLRLRLAVNELATLYYSLKSQIIQRYTKVQILLNLYKKLKKSVPTLFTNLMQTFMGGVEKVFEPCFSLVTWSSLNFDDYVANIESTLCGAEAFIKEVNDLREARIEEPLEALSKTMLVYIHPANLHHQEYLKRNVYFQKKITRRIQMTSRNMETATIFLINKFVDVTHANGIDEYDKWAWLNPDKVNIKSGSHIDLSSDRHQSEDIRVRMSPATTKTFKDDCIEVFNYFHEKFVCCLVKAMVHTLVRLRSRTNVSLMKAGKRPMLVSSINLEVPKIVERPTLYEVQTILNKVVAGALFITQELDSWATVEYLQHRDLSIIEYQANEIKDNQIITFIGNREYENMKDDALGIELPNLATVEGDVDSRGFPIITYFKAVAQHKEVMRHITALQDIFSVISTDVDKLSQKYYKFKDLWEEDMQEVVDKLVSSDPLPPQIRERFEYYRDAAADIQTIPNQVIIGPLEFNLKPLKSTLGLQCKAWSDSLGKKFGSLYHVKLKVFLDFINDHLVQLNRPVNDLDDCRLVMQCMEEIRDTFVDLNWELNKFDEVFFIFHQFKVVPVPGDIEIVDGLRFNYDNLLKTSVSMQALLCLLQKQLKRELLDGIAGFKASVDAYDAEFEEYGPMVAGLSAKEASDRVLLFQDRFEILYRKYEIYSSGERLFGMMVTDYPTLIERKKQFNLLQKLYGLYLIVNKTIDGYFEVPWYKINIETITVEINDFLNRCRKLPKGMKDWPAFIELNKKLNDFNESCPLIEMMANKAMKPRHWQRLEKLLNCRFDIDSDDFTLKNIMEAPLLKHKDEVEDICVSAVKEKDIESKLKQVIADWAVVDLQFAVFKNKGEVLIKGQEASEIISLLEDSLMVLASLATNRFNAFFKKDIMLWIYNLSTAGEILENWLIVQNLWIYLEAVFVGGDIAKQLPGEAKRFAMIDKSWLKIMQRARELVNCINVCVGDDTMKTLLPYLLEQLEACQKSLTGYLEQKRLIFPRFFFVSDPSLLEILGQASDPRTIQAHLLGVFENIAQVEFMDREKITKIISREGETIVLDKIVHCVGGVEFWLGALLDSAKHALGLITSQCWEFIHDEEFKVMIMVAKFPSQIGLLGLQMLWTRDSEKALRECHDDAKIMKKTNRYCLIILNALIDMTAKNLTRFERVRYETLITIHVHQRDIFEDMFLKKISNPEDFEWLKQERFYFDEDNDRCMVKITDVDFIYQNEFMGCTDRLVITPLTDRCYITLAQSIWMSMGGAPAGPAGTGKTETTKDMGKSLGKYVVVFNCSDQMDFRGLGRIFKGLAQSGSWGCFDEFNRIELPVLSVAAQQISIIFTARREKKLTFVFSDGDTVSLNYEFGFFITMNPGYAGRQELPENLKIMFRSVAMMVPDRHIIIRVKLASCGYRENIVLSRKFFILYRLCEEQLSKQVHYDFGLRNILSVLRTLGAQKRSNPKDSEDTVLMRVLRDMNVSKLVDEDEPLFLSLIDDLFVGLKLTTSFYKELQGGIKKACSEFSLTNHPPWNLKIVQLYETSLVRHGLMTMGSTGSGKSSCMNVLLSAFTDSGRPHREMRMNPKAITAPQMFGRLDAATNDWTDGIFSTLWRRSLKVKKTDFVWIVLDGPVDAVWIENLNSVLDDNKTLTLANGDRIVMAPNAKLVFEPDNVDNASPATVSRMGMVFLSSSVLNWDPILEAWLMKRKSREVEVLRPLFHKIYADAYSFVEAKLIAKMRILEALYVRQCLDILTGLIDVIQTGYEEEEEEELPAIELSPIHLEKYFLFSMMWSLGSVLELDQRLKLQQFLLEHPSKLAWPIITDESETIFEFFVTNEGEWNHWNKRVEEFLYPTDEVLEYASILVPNVDNVRTLFLIETIAKQGKGVLLIGEQGTAKTVMIKSFLSRHNPELHLSKSLNFSSATTPNMVQRIIESYLDKRIGTTFGPPNNRHMSIFIDDINMPIINEWGDQVTNEIVRQLMEQGGFYSLDKPGEFSTIVDIQFLAAMIHPGGGRNDIPPRLKRQFNIFNCTLPSDRSMDKIFSVIGEGYFCKERFKEQIVEAVPMLVPLTRILWQKTKVKMLPTPAKFHYVFNLRDLSRIWEGILYITDDEVHGITTLLKLWKHECLRVISDRFTNEEDKTWFVKCINETVSEVLPVNISPYYDPVETYFVDFLKEPPEPTGDEPEDFAFEAPKIYEELTSWEFLIEKLNQFVVGYNELVRGQPMDMVFFKDCMTHLIKVSRVIGTPRGSIMLVGVGGSGKRSITYLASYIAGYSNFSITLTRSYNVSNFMEDLKYLYRIAGGKNKGISFIFTDNDIKDEAFLEFLNNILSAGEVANLFAKDEMDELLNEIIPEMRKIQPKRVPTLDNLYDFFISISRKNLHLVLCFSPVSEKFRSRSLKFPGLISGCTIDWFSRWPKDALTAVANHFIFNFPIVCDAPIKQRLITLMGDVHDDIADRCIQYFDRYRRRTYVTPKSFLSFLQGYKDIYAHKNSEIDVLTVQMSTGLKKLEEAAESVNLLKVELVEKEKEIAVANAKTDVVLAEVRVKTDQAEVVKAEVKEVADKAGELVKVIEKDKVVAENKLELARPALEAAEAALQTITAGDISTVRKLGKPPYLITLIMDCVQILFQKKILPVKVDTERNFFFTNWEGSLKVMTDTRFLFNLQNFPKDTINGEMIDLLQPYFNYPLYTFANAKQACGNVAGLLAWTVAMQDFYGVNKEVLPLKSNLAVQQFKLNVAQKELGDAKAVLKAREDELAGVNILLGNALKEKKAVQEVADKCQARMDAASALLGGLSGEQTRWTEQLFQFKAETERLIGDVLLLTGFLSYMGPFNQEFRTNVQNSWNRRLNRLKIPVTDGLNVVESLVDAATIGEWNLDGLPNDDLSIQNGIIVSKAMRFPLLIDPQSQGIVWIKNKERANKLLVTSLNHKYFRQHLEDALSLGSPLLLEDILEDLDPVLDNVLEKNFIKVGTSLKVKLSDKEVDVMRAFRLYITTKLPNPMYTPEIYARTSIIDFTVTIKGLEDQLLGRVILTEKRELENERTALLADVTANKRKMKELEANLLLKLTTVKGSLVDDETVLQVLNVTKDTATSVRLKLKNAATTELKINAAREEFRPVAARGSVLYFLVVEMSMVNYMYQTSLVQFLERFDFSLDMSEKHQVTGRRIAAIIEYLTFEIFRYKCRGLYEKHKYLFTLLLALKIDIQMSRITHGELENLVKGGGSLNLNNVAPKPNFRWLTDTTWLNLVQLSSLPVFSLILDQLIHNEKSWKNWFEKPAPEEETFPEDYEKFSVFHKLLLIRAMCPDRILSQSKKYIASSLGDRFAAPVLLNLPVMLGESRPTTPMICFLSMGSDPTPMIETMAKRREIPLGQISMGQGQEIHARKLMAISMAEGGWVLLQNCHLGLDYMAEMFLALTDPEAKIDNDFRVWVTTEPHPVFPINLLQICIKFTFEPPQGLAAGLMRTYASMTQDFLDFSNDPHYLPLVYGISFLHSVVQERRKFGPLGWNIPYEFNFADWYASTLFVQNHLEALEKGQPVSWVTLRYMISEVQYGGRVTDDFDKRLLVTLTKVWFNELFMLTDFMFYRGYKVMKFRYLQQYLDAIGDLPSSDPPQALGLHPNANITFQASTAQEVLETIISIQPKEASAGGGETRESVVAKQVSEMLSKMPPDYDPYEVKERLKIMGILNSMNIFLRQELDRMQRVVSLVRKTLKDLLLAVEGTIIMNEALRDALDNIYDARVPNLWKRGSWQSSSIGFWFTELLDRSVQFNSWIFRGRPSQFWMTGFFNPQGFLTAMRQEIARAHKGWSLETVVLFNQVTKYAREQIRTPPAEGVYVYGLYLEGAGWDRKSDKLTESAMKVLYLLMPVIHVYAINAIVPPGNYVCPVYKRPARTDLNFITAVYLPCKVTPEHWCMRGVALLCDIK